MDNNNLFRLAAEGYDCAQVDEYIKLLRTEYKKVYDYAKAVESNNEKLKKICKSLSDENNELKATATAAAPAATQSANTAALIMSVERLSRLCDEIKLENNALREKIVNPVG